MASARSCSGTPARGTPDEGGDPNPGCFVSGAEPAQELPRTVGLPGSGPECRDPERTLRAGAAFWSSAPCEKVAGASPSRVEIESKAAKTWLDFEDGIGPNRSCPRGDLRIVREG